ncbi:hypothetical protein AAG570_004282 [Ranatra chinensis]|uniref:Uncharacterized protein n=1 Tax=Ranatra chinensis TaxID=642074 RepID=A0ABD0YM59_9HEMI
MGQQSVNDVVEDGTLTGCDPERHNRTTQRASRGPIVFLICEEGSRDGVSFGSSKGSMVETLIYESPLQEEPEPNPSADQSSIDSTPGDTGYKSYSPRQEVETEPPRRVPPHRCPFRLELCAE